MNAAKGKTEIRTIIVQLEIVFFHQNVSSHFYHSFVGQSQLLRHCTQHSTLRSFECEICKKFYKTKRDLKVWPNDKN